MKRSFLTGVVFLLLAALVCASLAESNLTGWVDAAEKLAFHTTNVTITGEAEFLLNGERFKTAEIAYRQDGKNSFWKMHLLTPRDRWSKDLESGFTVIQNGYDIYVMETMHPGLYRKGTDVEQTTLLQRGPIADLLLAISRTAADQLAPMLGTAISLTEHPDGGRDLHLIVSDETALPIMNHAALLAMEFAGKRLLNIDMDSPVNYDENGIYVPYSYNPPAREILLLTKELNLRDCVLDAAIDAQGRLTACSGEINARLSYYQSQDMNSEAAGDYAVSGADLTIRFSVSIGDYGSTVVELFDPEKLGVTISKPYDQEEEAVQIPLSDEEIEFFLRRVSEIAKLAGQSIEENVTIVRDGDWIHAFFNEGHRCYMTFTEEGLLLACGFGFPSWDGLTASDDALTPEMENWVTDFLKTVNPELTVSALKLEEQKKDDSGWIMDIRVLDENGEEVIDTSILLQWLPEPKLIDYTCVGHG